MDVRLDGLESVRVEHDPNENTVTLVITDGRRNVARALVSYNNVGEAEELVDLLDEARAAAQEIVDRWRDNPEDFDAFVIMDDGTYYVRLTPLSPERRPAREKVQRIGFPTKEIAMYELAELMVEDGHFPNAWYQYSAYTDDIDEAVRAFHDEGGTAMKPLEGVEYDDGAEVEVQWPDGDWLAAEVVRDYGAMGVVYVWHGDDTHHHLDDRSAIRPAPAEEPDEDGE